jgi:hypothetical protein
MRWSRLSSLFRRLLDLVVDPRLTEILVEVADIVVGAGEACPLRLGIRVGAAAFARLVLDAPTSLRLLAAVAGTGVGLGFRGRLCSLPAAVAGIGVGLGFRGRLCSLPGSRTLAVVALRTGLGRGLARLAVVVLRTGPGRGLTRLAVLVPRPGPSPGFARLDSIAPIHAVGWASVGVDGHGAWRPEKKGEGEEECCGGAGICGCRCERHCGKYQGGSTGRAHKKPPLGHGRIHVSKEGMPENGLDRCDGYHEMVDFLPEF